MIQACTLRGIHSVSQEDIYMFIEVILDFIYR